jgi:hypothetical protein
MSMRITWVDCGCCGRTHEDLPHVDCRAFETCPKCGDCYMQDDKHFAQCDGIAQSYAYDAVFTDTEAGV